MPGSWSKNIEQKYCFIGQQGEMLLDWLEHCCAHDPKFYLGNISTLYYDTTAFSLYDEKRNGDFIKSKVRLRWYDNLQALSGDVDVTCYLEVKRKFGALRQKDRLELPIPSKKLSGSPFSDKEILDLPTRAYDLEYLPPGVLVPMALIQYDRYRFIEPQSSTRVSLDINIRCEQVNTAHFPVLTPLFLGMGVLEIKGERRELPRVFNPIKPHLEKTAFSKYGQCLSDLMQPIDKRR